MADFKLNKVKRFISNVLGKNELNEGITLQEYVDIKGNISYLFHSYKNENIDFKLDTSKCNSAHSAFAYSKLTELPDWDYSGIEDFTNFLSYNRNIEKVKLNTNFIIAASGMFKDCNNLKTIDITNWKVDYYAAASGVFEGCSKLEKVIIRKMDDICIDVSNSFTNVPETCIFYVPDSSVNTLKTSNM